MKKTETKQMEKVKGGEYTPTADCIRDQYANHGWFSIGLVAASVVMPWQTIYKVAVFCAEEY